MHVFYRKIYSRIENTLWHLFVIACYRINKINHWHTKKITIISSEHKYFIGFIFCTLLYHKQSFVKARKHEMWKADKVFLLRICLYYSCVYVNITGSRAGVLDSIQPDIILNLFRFTVTILCIFLAFK